MRVSYTKVTVVEKQQVSRDTFLRRLLTPVHLLGRTFLMVHLIGFQTLQKCILSEFKSMFSAFYRNSYIFTIFVSTIYEKK